jgi:hypothetical protein
VLTPQQQQLGDEVVRRLQRIGHDDARFDANGFRVALAGGFVTLAPLWALRGDATFEEVLDQWVLAVGTLEAPDSDPTIARSRLRPRVSPRALHTRLALEGKLLDRPYTSVGGALTDELVVDVVYDFEHRRVPVTDAALKQWGLKRDVALDLAVAQQHRQTRFVERAPGLFTTAPDDGAAAVMLQWAHDEIRPQLGLKGVPVFLPLREDVLYIVGSEDPAAIDAMLASAARVGPVLSATPLVFSDRAFVPFQGIAPSALQALKHRHAVLAYQLAYGQPWESLLQAAYGVQQAALTDRDGQLIAVPPGWPCLLPRADVVQVGEGLVPMRELRLPPEPVEGLEPKVWLCEAPTSSAADR